MSKSLQQQSISLSLNPVIYIEMIINNSASINKNKSKQKEKVLPKIQGSEDKKTGFRPDVNSTSSELLKLNLRILS